VDKALLAELAQRFVSGTATDEEKALLHEWFDAADKEEIEQVFLPERETEDDVRTRMMAGIQSGIEQEPQKAPRRIGYYARWIAAATILVAVSLSGLYFWKAHKSRQPVGLALPVAAPHQDLKPGGNKATLLLGDGSIVNLGAVRNGVIRKVAGTSIDKQDGQLRYKVSGTNAAPEMNTIQTPRGGQYQVILPDGTKVWLDAASSLTYPTAFTGGERAVQLRGEAYFEVADNKEKPFKVMVGNMQVNVLGTHFNVMAYEDENAIQTTLLEGSVKVTNGGVSHLLKPGQQGRLDRSSDAFRLLDVDADEAVAWKNGVFEFGGISIETVMRQIVRWYDVEVEYQGRTNEHFRGTISRSANASEVFKMLELTGAVHFTIDGKKVIVKP
jgi:ferric-dicitrate binding protein FerR (iron transport regulator)